MWNLLELKPIENLTPNAVTLNTGGTLQVRLVVDVLRSPAAAEAASAANLVPYIGLLSPLVTPLLAIDGHEVLLAARGDDGIRKAAQELTVGESKLQVVRTFLALNQYGHVLVQAIQNIVEFDVLLFAFDHLLHDS